jgi:transcriptional regulator with XRE-family HTH domain
MSVRKLTPLPRHLRSLVNRALAGVIRRRRQRLRLSLEQLAKVSGISRQMLGYVEDDQRTLGVESLEAVAAPLGLTGSELLHEAEFWLKRGPACCQKCHYSCLHRGELPWLNSRRGCTRPVR